MPHRNEGDDQTGGPADGPTVVRRRGQPPAEPEQQWRSPIDDPTRKYSAGTGDAGAGGAAAERAGAVERAEAGARKANYFVRHWRGELSLGVSYWVNMVLLSVPLSIAGTVIGETGFGDIDLRLLPWLFFLFVAVALLVTLWQLVGTWRAASNHKERTGRKFWATVAQVLIVIGIIRIAPIVNELGPVTREMAEMAFNDPLADYELKVSPDGTALMVSGDIGAGITSGVEDLIERNPAVATLVLDSPGGRMGEGERLGRLARRLGLDTRVEELCASACTAAFVGGRRRILVEGGVLGFHAPEEIPGVFEPGGDDNREDRAYFAEAGLPLAVIDRIFATPSNDLWTPSADELLRAEIITRFQKRPRDPSIESARMQSIRKTVEDSLLQFRVVSVIRAHEPEAYERLIMKMVASGIEERTRQEITTLIHGQIASLFHASLRQASDDSLHRFVSLIVEQAGILAMKNPNVCVTYLLQGVSGGVLPYFPQELVERQMEVVADVVASAYETPSAAPNEDVGLPLVMTVFEVIFEKYGDDAMAFDNPQISDVSSETKCRMIADMYLKIGKLPVDQQGQVMRYMLTAAIK